MDEETQGDEAVKSRILGLEAERRAAMMAGDADKLAALLDDEASYYPGAGGRQSGEDMLAAIRAGTVKYLQIAAEEEDVVVFPGVAMVTGLLVMDVEVAGESMVNRRRFADLWIERPEGWRLAVYYGVMADADPAEIQSEIAAGVRRALAAKEHGEGEADG